MSGGWAAEGLWTRSRCRFEVVFEMYTYIYSVFRIICFVYLAVTANVRSRASTPLLKSRMYVIGVLHDVEIERILRI